MPYHRFKIGQIVTDPSIDAVVGPFVIARLLPGVGDEPSYRVTKPNGTEWELRESQIEPMRAVPTNEKVVISLRHNLNVRYAEAPIG
jgi:hypothetical protein